MFQLPRRNWNFCQISHHDCLIQAYKPRECFRQEIYFTNKNVRSFSSRRNFSHEIKVDAMMIERLEFTWADIPQHLWSAAGANDVRNLI